MLLPTPSSHAVGIDLSGPISGAINEKSSEFSLTVDKDFNGQVRVEILGGGLDYVLRVDFNKGDLFRTFTITPTALGSVTLVANPEGGPKIDKTWIYTVGTPTPTPTPTTTGTPTPTPTASLIPSSVSTSQTQGGSGVATLFYPLAPTSAIYDPQQDLTFSFLVAGINENILVTVFIPEGATDSKANVFVESLSTPAEVSAGQISVRLNMFLLDTNTSIATLKIPMEIRFWTPYKGFSYLLIEETGTFQAIESIGAADISKAPTLGLKVNVDSTYSIFSTFLSDFVTTNELGSSGVINKKLKVAINAAAQRNRIYYLNSLPKNKVFIDFATKFASKSATLEIRRYNGSRLGYSQLVKLVLDEQGDGTYVTSKPLLKGDRLRVLINGSAIKYATV